MDWRRRTEGRLISDEYGTNQSKRRRGKEAGTSGADDLCV